MKKVIVLSIVKILFWLYYAYFRTMALVGKPYMEVLE